MPANSSRSTGKPRSIAAGPLPSSASSCSASSSSPSQPRCRRPTTSSPASSGAPSTRCMTAAMTPSPASCNDSSSAPARRSSSTTAGPSPRYTAPRRAERCSSESISLSVVLRCCRSSVDVPGGTSRHLSTPKRPARVAPLLPRPSRRSWRPDPAATHLSAFSEVMEPLLVHPSADSPKPRRQTSPRPFSEARPASRRSSLSSRRLWGAHSSVVANSHDQRSRPDCRNRGKPITLVRAPGSSLSSNAPVSASENPASTGSSTRGKGGPPRGTVRRARGDAHLWRQAQRARVRGRAVHSCWHGSGWSVRIAPVCAKNVRAPYVRRRPPGRR